MLDTFGRSEDASHVDVLRGALGKERLHTHLHADAGGKHRVGDDERLVGVYLGGVLNELVRKVKVDVGYLFPLDSPLGALNFSAAL